LPNLNNVNQVYNLKKSDNIYLEDTSPVPHQWEDIENYVQAHDHPLWKKWTFFFRVIGLNSIFIYLLYRFVDVPKICSYFFW